ncbi:hypothetical protein AA11825_0587 [Acetobacter pomorum DSM 11825]|nr:hypothetical protein AA11825_0587 [Acetobacter pomorum DSM 11825]
MQAIPTKTESAAKYRTGDCTKTAIILILITAPITVPITRHTLLETIAPTVGFATIRTVVAALRGE